MKNEFAHNTRNCVIEDPYGRRIEGKFIRRVSNGVIMDDCRGVRHHAFPSRVISAPDTVPAPTLPPGLAPAASLPPGLAPAASLPPGLAPAPALPPGVLK